MPSDYQQVKKELQLVKAILHAEDQLRYYCGSLGRYAESKAGIWAGKAEKSRLALQKFYDKQKGD